METPEDRRARELQRVYAFTESIVAAGCAAGRQHEMVREVMARRIIAVASIGERDRVRLRAAALAGRHAKLVEATDLCHSRQKSLNRFGANAVQTAMLRLPPCPTPPCISS